MYATTRLDLTFWKLLKCVLRMRTWLLQYISTNWKYWLLGRDCRCTYALYPRVHEPHIRALTHKLLTQRMSQIWHYIALLPHTEDICFHAKSSKVITAYKVSLCFYFTHRDDYLRVSFLKPQVLQWIRRYCHVTSISISELSVAQKNYQTSSDITIMRASTQFICVR